MQTNSRCLTVLEQVQAAGVLHRDFLVVLKAIGPNRLPQLNQVQDVYAPNNAVMTNLLKKLRLSTQMTRVPGAKSCCYAPAFGQATASLGLSSG